MLLSFWCFLYGKPICVREGAASRQASGRRLCRWQTCKHACMHAGEQTETGRMRPQQRKREDYPVQASAELQGFLGNVFSPCIRQHVPAATHVSTHVSREPRTRCGQQSSTRWRSMVQKRSGMPRMDQIPPRDILSVGCPEELELKTEGVVSSAVSMQCPSERQKFTSLASAASQDCSRPSCGVLATALVCGPKIVELAPLENCHLAVDGVKFNVALTYILWQLHKVSASKELPERQKIQDMHTAAARPHARGNARPSRRQRSRGRRP
jgi:hypothetical protein